MVILSRDADAPGHFTALLPPPIEPEAQHVQSQDPLPRRSAFKMLGALGAASALPGCAAIAAQSKPPGAPTDADIFNFALNLESLETEYYLRGTTGRGIDDADAGPNPGSVNGGHIVPWQNDDLRQFKEEVAQNELAHVRCLRRAGRYRVAPYRPPGGSRCHYLRGEHGPPRLQIEEKEAEPEIAHSIHWWKRTDGPDRFQSKRIGGMIAGTAGGARVGEAPIRRHGQRRSGNSGHNCFGPR